MGNSEQGAFACASDGGYQLGLTKREWFAGMALQGLIACSNYEVYPGKVSIVAYNIADAMIKAGENNV